MPHPLSQDAPSVLVVEDEALVRMTLDDAGFNVIEAIHADDALQVLQSAPGIQAVVTDVEMPRGSINGFDLARRVRADRRDIGILIMSGRVAPKQKELPEGALFIGKPVDPDTLVKLPNSVLRSAEWAKAKLDHTVIGRKREAIRRPRPRTDSRPKQCAGSR